MVLLHRIYQQPVNDKKAPCVAAKQAAAATFCRAEDILLLLPWKLLSATSCLFEWQEMDVLEKHI